MNSSIAKGSQQGVALVTTVIVVAVMAVVAVAFLQSTSTDRLSSRTVANHYRARLAAEAGLAGALAQIQNALGGNFAYVSGSEPDGDTFRTFIRPLDGASGVWQFNGDPVYLDSGSGGEAARFVLTGSEEDPVLVRSATWQEMAPLEGAKENETTRYAFWADEAGSKQNLTWWGGSSDRGTLADLSELQLVLPEPNGTDLQEFPPSAMAAVVGERTVTATNYEIDDIPISSVSGRSSLPSVATANLVDESLDGKVNTYFFALNSLSGAASPSGRLKLNFAALARYIDGLAADQGAAGARAQLVDQLLEENPDQAENWGGGSLSWLAEVGKYSAAEQRQIVANIIDYLDSDLIPTTDSVDTPTYFGVESKLQANGTVRGHPFINMLGLGSVFNWSATGPGNLNSTRLLAFLGVVNPWSAAIPSSDYTPEITVEVDGTVAGGTRGNAAQGYFKRDLDEQLQTRPVASLPPRSGFTFPGPPSGNNYANFNSFFLANSPEPPTVVFSDLTYRPTKARLRFTDSDGRTGYVQILPNTLSVTGDPKVIASPKQPASSSAVYKFTRLAPAQQDLHLQGDPRRNAVAGSWINRRSTDAGANPPTPASPVDIFAAPGEDWDGAQGLPATDAWYRSTAVTNHFNRQSSSGMASIGELGFIWTGKPWQTLNMVRVANAATADWNLLDYVSAGRSGPGGAIVGVLPLKVLGDADSATPEASLVAEGGFNINTRKAATLAAFMTNAPGLGEDAAQLVMESTEAPEASAYGQIASWANGLTNFVAGAPTQKFALEAAQRALANAAVNHSRIFTVYAAGEYRLGTTRSRALLEADVFVGVDVSGKPKIQVINQTYR